MPQTVSVHCSGGELTPISFWLLLWGKLLCETKLILFLLRRFCCTGQINSAHPSPLNHTYIHPHQTKVSTHLHTGKGNTLLRGFSSTGEGEGTSLLWHAYPLPCTWLQSPVNPPISLYLIYRLGQRRLTVVHMGNNIKINKYNTIINSVSHIHNYKPTLPTPVFMNARSLLKKKGNLIFLS